MGGVAAPLPSCSVHERAISLVFERIGDMLVRAYPSPEQVRFFVEDARSCLAHLGEHGPKECDNYLARLLDYIDGVAGTQNLVASGMSRTGGKVRLKFD